MISSLPSPGWAAAHPWAAAGAALVAGLVDGFNPCAFATLLVFLSAVLAALGGTAAAAGMAERHRAIWRVGGAFIAGIFVLYFALGAGFLQLTWLRVLGNAHLGTRLAALVALALGLVMVREYFIPQGGLRLGVPQALHQVVRRWTRQTTPLAAFVGGGVIGACTVPCSGAVYLAALALIAGAGSLSLATGLLTLYNLAFILPLVLIVLTVSNRTILRRVSHWHQGSRRTFKLVLGLTALTLGFVVLTTL